MNEKIRLCVIGDYTPFFEDEEFHYMGCKFDEISDVNKIDDPGLLSLYTNYDAFIIIGNGERELVLLEFLMQNNKHVLFCKDFGIDVIKKWTFRTKFWKIVLMQAKKDDMFGDLGVFIRLVVDTMEEDDERIESTWFHRCPTPKHKKKQVSFDGVPTTQFGKAVHSYLIEYYQAAKAQ